MGKGKKGRKQDDDWENDLEDIAKDSGITLGGGGDEDFEMPVVKKKEKKNKKKKSVLEEEEDDEEENGPVPNKQKGNAGKLSFSALVMEGDGSGDESMSDKSEEEIMPIPKSKGKKKEQAVEDKKEENSIISEKVETSEKKKGKGKKKEKKKEEEDIDALLADLELSEKKEPESKKGKKKGKKKDAAAVIELETTETEETAGVIDGNKEAEESKKDEEKEGEAQEASKGGLEEDVDEGPKIKTAAQKKAEKKEREKQKKEAQKAAAKKAKEKEEAKKGAEAPTESMETATEEGATDVSSRVKEEGDDKQTEGEDKKEEGENKKEEGEDKKAESGESDAEGEAKDKKKKKKKKKKTEEEKEKPKAKKVGGLSVKKMQEMLKMKKEEEERLKQEQEAKIKALEEAENRRLEKLRLEQERKDKKKQKEKERKERLKKEGKLLTPQQREAKRRAEMMLLAMKEKGLEVPSKDVPVEKKKVQYVTKKQKNKQVQSQTSEESEVPAPAASETPAVVAQPESEKKEESKEEPEDDAPDSWDLIEDLDEVKDSWDAKSEEEKKTEAPKAEVAKAEETKPEAAVPEPAAEESSEEEEDEDEEEESSSEEEEESSDEESESESEDEKMTPEKIKERAKERIQKRRERAENNRSTDKLRCPVICVLGHVDTGKTKILDKIRHTHVQDGEAGGITQQIGATLVPVDAIKDQTKMIKDFGKFDLRLPGLLIIDTPGHESFSNLRTRGSSLCDMAILVVDIMHGLEPQTIESINLLRKKHTPFVVALNKIDRLFEWKRGPASQVEDTIKKQKKNTKLEFEERMQHIIGEFAEQGLNAALFYKNMDEKIYISLVPTSAHSGDGMGDLMALICKLTQERLAKKLAYSEELQSTVMEVKALPGLGTTVDVILVNGKLKEGDTIVTGGLEGPIVTQIRAILTPQPLRELRVKSQYIQHKEIEAAQGVKITGKDLEKVMAGAPLFVAEKDDEVEVYKDEVQEIVADTLKAIKVVDRGVYVQASTLGSLEALLEFLKTSKIPYAGVNIGPVHKKDVMRASVMLEHEKMFAVILAFDVKVEREAQEFADKEGVKIFTADIIYHLFDKFTAYTEEYKQKKREEFKNIAVFPAKLRVLPQHIFNSRDPIVIGVHVEGGCVRLGTPLTVPSKEFTEIGFVTGLEANHKQMEKAVAGQEVCVKIEPVPGDAPKMYGRHFTHEDLIMSKISRESIDALKNYFREDMTKQDWQLIIEMKKIFGII